MKNLYNAASIEPACMYCLKGHTTADEKTVLCLHKGVMGLSGNCKHFTYNPLKREPKVAPDIAAGSLEEFAI